MLLHPATQFQDVAQLSVARDFVRISTANVANSCSVKRAGAFSFVVVGTLKEHVTRFQPEHKLADSDDPDGYTKDEERVVRLLNQRTDTTSF